MAAMPALELAPLPATAPLVFFERACASCHGPFGMFYGEEFAATGSDAALIKVVREMVEGPGRSTLDALSLDALVAFHRSLRERPQRPFIVITAVEDGIVRGEASPGAKVSVVIDGYALPASLDGFEWSVELPAGWDRSRRLVIRAERDAPASITEIDLSATSFSHSR